MAEGRDWTVYLHEPCPDCAGDVQTVGVEDLGRAVTDAVAAFARTLAAADPQGVRARPSDGDGAHSSTPATSVTSSASSNTGCGAP